MRVSHSLRKETARPPEPESQLSLTGLSPFLECRELNRTSTLSLCSECQHECFPKNLRSNISSVPPWRTLSRPPPSAPRSPGWPLSRGHHSSVISRALFLNKSLFIFPSKAPSTGAYCLFQRGSPTQKALNKYLPTDF